MNCRIISCPRRLTVLAFASLLATGVAQAESYSFTQSYSSTGGPAQMATSSQSASHSDFTVDLNGDGRPDHCETVNNSLNGRLSGHTACYLTLRDGRSQRIFELPYPVSTFNVPGSHTNGWADIVTQVNPATPPHTWRWNGQAYR